MFRLKGDVRYILTWLDDGAKTPIYYIIFEKIAKNARLKDKEGWQNGNAPVSKTGG